MSDSSIPIHRLRARVDYNQDTGVMIWRDPPLGDFPSEHQRNAWAAKFVGKQVGTIDDAGYLHSCLTIDGKRIDFRIHSAAWALVTGAWPENEIDHWNKNKTDNRFLNLRDATRSENQWNTGFYKNNTSGLTGAHWDRRDSRWVAQIRVKRQLISLGRFDTVEAAHAAYLAAKSRFHLRDQRTSSEGD